MTEKNTINDKLTKEAKLLAFLSGKKRTFAEILFCALAGWAFCTIFEVYSFHILAWAGLLPLFFLTYARSKKRAFLYGFLWGYFWHLGSFFWLREIVFFIPFALAGVLAFFNGIFALFLPFFFKYLLMKKETLLLEADKRNSFPCYSSLAQMNFTLAVSSLWVVLEYIRSHIFTGLPWNLLGSSQWKVLSIIQIADLTGIFGISFLIVSVNAALFLSLLMLSGKFTASSSPLRKAFPMPFFPCSATQKNSFLKNYRRPAALLFSLALVAAASSYSIVQLKKYHTFSEQEGILFHAGIVQPDLSQRRHGGEDSTREALAVCTALSEELFRKGKTKPHTVIWPETAVPCPFNASLPMSNLLRSELYRMITSYHTPFLFGSIRLEKHPEKEDILFYNSAILWEKGNKVNHFDKIHIVPFGEYVPYGETFPVLNRLVGMGRNLSRGKQYNFLELHKGVKAGISICYEDVFPYISRNHALNGTNLLLTITNDAWYPTSNEPAQHFVNSLFRAIECRLPFLRVGNLDYSCAIAPTGQIIQAFAADAKGRPDPSFRGRKSGVFSLYVPEKPSLTFYTKYGDVFTGICLLIFLFLLANSFMNLKWVKSSLLASFDGEEENKNQERN